MIDSLELIFSLETHLCLCSATSQAQNSVSPCSSSQNKLPEKCCAAAPLVFSVCRGRQSRTEHHLALQRQEIKRDQIHIHAAHHRFRRWISEAWMSLP